MHRFSHYYNEPLIFNNVLYAFLLNIIGSVIAMVVIFAYFIGTIGTLSFSNGFSFAQYFTQMIILYIVIFGIMYIFSIVGGVLYMRAFNKLAEKSGVDSFHTAGLLYLIGTILSFFGIIVWIAWIFSVVGFRRLKPLPQQASAYYAPYPPQSYVAQGKRCAYCGTENSPDASYCRICGRPLQ
ncbi:MAG: DUF973 family protein [Candidatus Bathyarchaeota archaeon]|nr:DUF973 family protein [Candidatus Bathyarchaeota archaeon]